MHHDSPWQNVPRINMAIFLAAVFCVFAGVAFASDSINMGRQPVVRFAISVVVMAGFAVCYASAGIILRRRSWKVFLPLFAAQFLVLGLLANRFPDRPVPSQYSPAATVLLQRRITFDSAAIIISVILGYIGFLSVSIREGRRHIRIEREKAALDSEMAAAREIQRLMVPEELPPTPGYRLECVYRPAAQVGGDFFQVIPLKGGHTLVIVGDVSGKGLSAAMIVSMLIGTLGAITSFTEEPAQILDELNRRLFGRTHGGFVTCAVMRLEQNGQLTLANAGHLPPYLNAIEVPFSGSLPLGAVSPCTYDQTAFDIRAGDCVLLLTDGIIEAQNAQGQLLGFQHVETLMRHGATAQALAEAAQQHGQTDDITAIAIQREANPAISHDPAAATLPVAS